MPSKLYDDYSAGVDRRRERSMSEAGKAWSLRNCYADTGRRLRARPGAQRGTALTACDGLVTLNGIKYTFAIKGTGFSAPGYTVVELDSAGGGGAGNTALKQVWFAASFTNAAGALHWYVVVEYGDGTIRHHYTDGADTRVKASATASSLVETTVVGIAGNRVWCATASGTVRFSGLGEPRDWDSTTQGIGAGFLALNAQMPGVGNCTAIGVYQNDVAFFFREATQVWYPDVEKERMFIRQRIPGVGTELARAVVAFGDDLMFVGANGIKSLSVSTQTNSRIETDIGSAIEDYPIAQVEEAIGAHYFYRPVFPRYPAALDSAVQPREPFGRFFAKLGQVWLAFPGVVGRTDLPAGPHTVTQGASDATAIVVLTYSRNAALASWSSYTVPFVVKEFAEITVAGRPAVLAHYNTSGSAPHHPREVVLSAAHTHDVLANGNAAAFDVEIELAFLDMDAPGAQKIITGADLTVTPGCELSFLYAPNDESKETVPIPIVGPDTREDGMIPVEITATAVAPKIRHTVTAAGFRFSGLQLYYETLWPA